jgi:hypothetical protein
MDGSKSGSRQELREYTVLGSLAPSGSINALVFIDSGKLALVPSRLRSPATTRPLSTYPHDAPLDYLRIADNTFAIVQAGNPVSHV